MRQASMTQLLARFEAGEELTTEEILIVAGSGVHLRAEHILILAAAGEGEMLEYKLQNEGQPDVSELLAALANAARGATVLSGVADDGEIIGVKRANAIISLYKSAARNCKPPLEEPLITYPVEVEGKQIVVATLPPLRDAVYSHSGIYRQRSGSANVALSDLAFANLVLARRGRGFDQRPVSDATIGDLDPALITALFEGRAKLGALFGDEDDFEAESFPSTQAFEVLASLGVLKREGGSFVPTYAGILVAGRDPQRSLPEATLQCVRFRDQTALEIVDRLELHGTTGKQLRGAVAFVSRNTPMGAKIEVAEREDIPAYPPPAVREMIVNALMHRDYQREAKVNLNIFSDRIEVLSPGGLLPGLNIGDLEGQHELRNKTLGPLMLWLRQAEGLGTGVRRMRAALRQAGMADPIFESSEYWFRAVIYAKDAVMDTTPLVAVRASGSGAAPVVIPQPWFSLNERQHQLLRDFTAARGGEISTYAYSKRFDISVPQALRDLNTLVGRSLMDRVGRGKRTLYIMRWHSSSDVDSSRGTGAEDPA